jgi:glyoxylase-like metal-dependent hydrolase (beta-lactamase superfamily II)
VLGGAEVGGIVMAHELTAAALLELAARDWSDEGLDRAVAAGRASARHAAHVKEELPSPRTVEVAPADVVFREGLELELGGVSVRVTPVGGDHCPESCVMYVEPDRVLFLGDCLCASPEGALTAAAALPLCDTLLAFDADLYVEGHHPAVSSRRELEALVGKLRLAEESVRAGSPIAAPDEDTASFLEAFGAR